MKTSVTAGVVPGNGPCSASRTKRCCNLLAAHTKACFGEDVRIIVLQYDGLLPGHVLYINTTHQAVYSLVPGELSSEPVTVMEVVVVGLPNAVSQ